MKMKPSQFKDLSAEEQDWIDAYLNGTIDAGAFESLQERLTSSPALRAVMRRYLVLDHHLQQNLLAGSAAGEPWLETESAPTLLSPAKRSGWLIGWMPIAAAAAVAFVLGLASMHWGGKPPEGIEPSAQGFAVVGRLFDTVWPEETVRHREGDTLGAETFQLASGTAEIQFFSGAMMTVEGPAEIALTSAWEAACQEGTVRMRVPPAARGFKLLTPSSQIVDLGTEFGLEVRGDQSHVEVFDGEIAVQHEHESERLIRKGAAWGLPADGTAKPTETGGITFPDVRTFGTRAAEQQRSDFARWEEHRNALAQDPRLIAYYTLDRDDPHGLIPNVTEPRNAEYDGAVVLAEPVDGRWPGLKSALEFRRPGARVRVNIPGEFPAFTFMTWVRIDSLDRWYNALFMGDGYETGEPHWQIRDDGKMMLSVMVDDTRPNPYKKDDAGFHRVYFSPPMWDRSMSGQWMHLCSVFDPDKRLVAHYVNGERISEQEIVDDYLIKTLRIGNGEIGNWGLPFRQDPTFGIRNLNGRMDELAIFKAAFSAEEIAALYERSRSSVR